MSAYIERRLNDAAELRRLAGYARDCATRAMAAGDLAGGAEWMRQAEVGERTATSVEARAKAAAHRERAANHRAFGHVEAAEECERLAAECDQRARG